MRRGLSTEHVSIIWDKLEKMYLTHNEPNSL